MTLEKAIDIVLKWKAGNYATQIDDMNPALDLIIEAAKDRQQEREAGLFDPDDLLPGETTE